MNKEILGIILMYVLVMLFAIPLGRYIGKIFTNEKTWLDKIFNPIDRLFFKVSGIDVQKQMNWKQHLIALLTTNIIWFLISMLVLTNMSWLPLNPDANPSMNGDQAFNTATSFICNTNLQHYSGESGLSYLGQLVLMLWQFVSAGCGIAIAAVVFLAMRAKATDRLGNFYHLFVRSCTRILFPIAVVVALLLVFNNTPMTMEGKDTMISLQGDTMHVSTGPVAAFAMAERQFDPRIKSPSQCPGTARSATSAGRSLIKIMFGQGGKHLLRRKLLLFIVLGDFNEQENIFGRANPPDSALVLVK